MNQLFLESSPYLLQHANNPVFWKPWNPKTLSDAKSENKLIIVSVGYSACHWCHVMEHESFEDLEVAKIMNSGFISIKVDREERPDVDAVYMKAVQIMTNSGGWPMNMICLPDGRPVWGGTYFRKNEWINSLQQLQELYATNPEKMIDYAQKLQSGMAIIGVLETPNKNTDLSPKILFPLVEKWKKSFDWEFGAMARAPKFMMPNNYAFLMRYGFENNDQNLLEFVNLTLTKMAWGGLFDTVDGGFSRYSVDMKWHIPHFEKMLYDNAQLVSLYSDGYKLTKNPLYKSVIEKTLHFVEKEWFTDQGGFYSALDADSLDTNNLLKEGAFYVWTAAELKNILGEDYSLFEQVFNINDFGFWEENHFVLIQNQTLELIASQNKITTEFLQNKKQIWEKLLYTEREKRAKPRLDDKCLTSWNALMGKGFLDAYKSIGNEKYLEIGIKNAVFIIQNLWSLDGNLFRNFKNGKATINGYLEDYSSVINHFITLYEITFDDSWLQKSKQLTDYCLDHFYDIKTGFFSFTSNLDDKLISEHYEIEDNVIPASNSVIATILYKMSIYFENEHYKKTCLLMLQQVIPNIDYPSAYSNWMNLLLNFSEKTKELAICSANATSFAKQINSEYLPHLVMAGTQKETKIPFLKNRFLAHQDVFYLCQNQNCQKPVNDFNTIRENLIY